jgi:ABC-type Na+ efflux pump permease subunit
MNKSRSIVGLCLAAVMLVGALLLVFALSAALEDRAEATHAASDGVDPG